MELYELLKQGENADTEYKLAEGGLPKDLWETYSAFANTDGGSIFLGVKEKDGAFSVNGIDADKISKQLWDTINNPQKASINILSNHDIQILTYDEKDILRVRVPRATRQQKPVYINNNPISGTYRRNYEGDYRCTAAEVRRMLADQAEVSQDSKVLSAFGVEDLSLDSIKSYRERLSSRRPDHPWLGLEMKEFLQRIGAYGRDREHNVEGITLAGLIMFGKEWTITEVLPNYFVDYREKYNEESGSRWVDRIISTDGSWSGNIYDFYYSVSNKLAKNLNVPFKIEGLTRKDDTNVHLALREALANSLIHADYYGEQGIVIEKDELFFRFSNPGTLRISIEQAMKGGVSDPRNPLLFKMFNLLGVGERAGSGIEEIRNAWEEQNWKVPDLREEFSPDRTVLTLRTTSLLPNDSLDFLQSVLGASFYQLNKNEVVALVTAHQEEIVTNTRLQILTKEHPADITKLLTGLVDKNLLEVQGQRRGARYALNRDFYIDNNDPIQPSILKNDELNNKNNMLSNDAQRIGPDNQRIGPSDQRTGPDNQRTGPVGDLESINDTETLLWEIAQPIREKKKVSNQDEMKIIILALCSHKALTLDELGKLLDRSTDRLRKTYLKSLCDEGKLEYLYPDQIHHPNQAYRTSNELYAGPK